MVWGAATKIVSKLVEVKDNGKVDRDNIVKKTLGLADTGIPIGREDEPAGYVRWKAAANDAVNDGRVMSADKQEVRYREFLWTEKEQIDECEWGAVRWRFYSNGLVCFDAQMCNSSGKLDNGDVQGHRIELRETNGLLLGVWIAGFFVRRSLPLRGFAASFSDDHQPLKLHFDEINESQRGAWICI